MASRSISFLANAVLSAVFCAAGSAATFADSILLGNVTDAITGLPVAGAQVSVKYGDDLKGSATTDIDGTYRVAFTGVDSALANMTVMAVGAQHALAMQTFQLVDGNPTPGASDVRLYPIGVAECRSQTRHSVIVGYFLPPIGSSITDLPERIARALDNTLSPSLQTAHLHPDLQPSFENCNAAQPKVPRFASSYAKALKADAFIGGYIAQDPLAFTINTYVGDAHDLFAKPLESISTNVDLANPSAATVSREIHAVVLAAVAAGLARNNKCIDAISVIAVAEQLVKPAPYYLKELREQCESMLPNVGLLGGKR